MAIPIFQVDAFTMQPFSGNPAAVCLLDRKRDEAWMQAVAAEMNLSETAFLVPGKDAFSLRWFTPAAEVKLCGHATLASAHVLWSETTTSDVLRFETKSGVLTARRKADLIELDFPALRAQAFELPPGIVEALGVAIEYCGRSRDDLILTVKDETTVRNISPDFARLSTIDVRGIMVTAVADGDAYDFVSRFFAPRLGINEDPVTGSAHCCLGPFWAERLGQNVLRGFQASPRGGLVEVEVSSDRVKLRGRAVTIFRGELLV
jgi:PhzF family phenazine biosynthesis protein